MKKNALTWAFLSLKPKPPKPDSVAGIGTWIVLLAIMILPLAQIAAQPFAFSQNELKISELISEIEKQTNYLFVYNRDNIDVNTLVTIQESAGTVDDLMGKTFNNTNIDYSIQGNSIMLTKRLVPANTVTNARANNQNDDLRKIEGIVTDDKGMPMQMVNVVIKGTTTGTTTNELGYYALQVKPGMILQFLFTGFKTVEVPVLFQETINVRLIEDIMRLDEIVVTAMGIQRQARELGYSMRSIGIDELDESKPADISQALAGRVSGLMVNVRMPDVIGTDGRIGEHTTALQLRGQRSFNNAMDNSPMLVVDGVPTPLFFLNTLHPSEIENVSIMKGASGAALYGSQAVNGVIYVTTKKGKIGRPQVTYSFNQGFDRLAHLPKLQTEHGAGYLGDPVHGFAQYSKTEHRQWGPKYTGEMVEWGNPIFDPNNPESGEQMMIEYAYVPGGRESFFDTGITTQHNVTYNVASDRSRMFFSYAANNIQALTPGEKSNGHNLRLNTTHTYGIFTLAANISYAINNSNLKAFTASPVAMMNGLPSNIMLSDYKDWENTRGATPDDWFTTANGTANPYFRINNLRQDIDRRNLLARFEVNLKPVQWLDITGRAGIAHYLFKTLYAQNAFYYSDWAKTNMNKVYARNDIRAQVFEYRPTGQNINFDLLMNTRHKIGDFSLGGGLGAQMIERYNDHLQVGGSALLFDHIFNIRHSTTPVTANHHYSQVREMSVFGSFEAAYKNWAYVQLTGRNDWTSVLDPSNWSYFYPGANASLIVSEMIPFLKEIDFLSYTKLRGSWAKVGAVGIGPYMLDNVFLNTMGFPFRDGSLHGYNTSGTIQNRYIRPEFTTDRELGIEMGVMDDRIIAEFTYYHQTSTDMTVTTAVSRATGAASTRRNLGKMESKGYEIDLRMTPLVNLGPLMVSTNINFTYLDNRVLELYDDLEELSIRFPNFAVLGERYPTMRAFSDYARDPDGRIIVNAVTGYPTIQWGFQEENLGTTIAPYRLGATLNMSWKGLRFSVTGDYRTGHVYQHLSATGLLSSGASEMTMVTGRQRFVIPNSVTRHLDDNGDEYFVPNTNITTDSGLWTFWQTRIPYGFYTTSAAAIKIREMSLTYEVPVQVLQRLRVVQRLSLGVYGRNLFHFYPDTNIWGDPEISGRFHGNEGSSHNSSPNYRTFGINVNATF